MYTIDVENISKWYGTQEVLKSLHFKIGKGEVVGFLGPNGAGKTTTMKLLTGSIPYTEGSIKICNMEVAENLIAIKRCIGYLPEQNPLYGDMYVKEFLHFVASTFQIKQKNAKVNALIEQIGLQTEFKKKIKYLSKGYRQRIGLAQALINDPKVLILDEPTTGLDPNQLIEIRNLIKRIGQERTVLFSTHITQEVEAVCNRAIIIDKGKIVEDLDWRVQSHLNLEQRIMIDVEFIDAILVSDLEAMSEVVSVETITDRHFRLICHKDIREQLFDLALQKQNKTITLQIVNRSIEEVFREKTAERKS